jgi:hypothetical protein
MIKLHTNTNRSSLSNKGEGSQTDLSMALQPFVGPWPLFKFLDFLHSRHDPLDGGSPRRKATTCTLNSTNRE